MKIECVSGYFLFTEQSVGELSRFMSMTGFPIEKKNDHYTFEQLLDVPEYSIKGNPIKEATAIKTFQGKPWELFEANQVVFNLKTGTVVPLSSVTLRANIKKGVNYYLTDGLLVPGSLMDDGKRVTEYTAWYIFETGQFRYTEVGLV